MKLILLVAVVAIIQPCLGIDPVPALNITRYLGRWYQIYADKVVMSTFERDGVCISADYTLRKDGKIGVFNSQRIKSITGDLKNITGYAYAPDEKEPGKLKVHFDVAPVDGDYWIVSLGPATFGGESQYQYSIITDRLKITMFVLARDPQEFKKEYDGQVRDFLNKNGFSHFWNKAIPTVQSEECRYPEPRRSVYQTAEEYFSGL